MSFVANFIRFPAVHKFKSRFKFDQVSKSLKVGTFLRHSVFADYISVRYLILRLRFYYFRFRKKITTAILQFYFRFQFLPAVDQKKTENEKPTSTKFSKIIEKSAKSVRQTSVRLVTIVLKRVTNVLAY